MGVALNLSREDEEDEETRSLSRTASDPSGRDKSVASNESEGGGNVLRLRNTQRQNKEVEELCEALQVHPPPSSLPPSRILPHLLLNPPEFSSRILPNSTCGADAAKSRQRSTGVCPAASSSSPC